MRALGADHVIDYVQTPDWAPEVRRLTDGLGADLIVETQGSVTIEQSVRAAALYGEIVLLRVNDGVQISGEAYGGTMVGIRREFVGSRADLEAMNRAISLAWLRPVVDREFSFEEVHEAYRYYLKDTSFGKVVVNVAA